MAITRRELLRRAGTVAGVAAASAAVRTAVRPRRAWAVGRSPTIVIIITDDMRFDFRTVISSFGGGWIDCVNAAIETPLCGPGRAGIIRGTYSARTGVTSNVTTDKMVDSDTIGTRIKAAGYRTILTGKYLNDYPWKKGRTYVPPGWDVWNAAGSSTWKPGSTHTTDYVFGNAVNQIRSTSNTTPLFLYIAPQAPHLPANPPARFANAFPVLPPLPPSFNEADVSDKPKPNNAAKPLTATQIAQVATDRLQIGRCLLGVNDGIASLLSALSDTGRLPGSAIFFTSDNGYMLGEHRLFKKGEPYEEPSHIPFVVRWPGVSTGRTETAVISSIDLAATVCVMAGATPPSADGVDLSPVFDSAMPVRDAAYIEAAGSSWDALRSAQFKYAERSDGGRELYDLVADPFEMSNLASDPAQSATRATLAARLAQLRP